MIKKILNTKELVADKSDEHTYFNIRMDNMYRGDETPKRAVIDIKGDFLDKQSDYKMTVTFWNIRGDIPLFVFPILEGLAQANPDLSPFGVCYEFGGNDYPANVIYVPDNTITQPRPPSQNNGNQVLSPYYFVYSFENMIDMINTAFNNAYVAFNAVHPGIHSSPVWVQYEPTTGLISLIAEYSYSQLGGATVYINDLLLTYLEAMRVNFIGYNQTNFKDYAIIFYIKPGNGNAYALPGDTVPLPPANPDYLIYTQEYDVRYLWNNIRAILFTSSTILSRDEYMPTVQSFTTSNTNTFNPNTRNVLSYYDIINEPNQSPSWRQYLYYNPQIYKWIDLVGDDSLSHVNIEVFYQLTNGSFIPVFIPSNQAIDIKILFKKKK